MWLVVFILLIYLFVKVLYLFILQRGAGKEKERERNISVWLPLMCPPNWGPGPQPRHVPRLGIELAALWFVGPCSIH